MAAPWMKFYPRDWRGDQALRAVSIAARGLWMECLCIMHEAKPYGHLVLNGEPVGDDALARMTGVPADEVSALLAELRQAGVLSVTRRGIVFSRRMTKDHARAQKGKAAAEKRWKQPTSDETQAPDAKQKSGAPNGSPNGRPITQKPEAREQTEEKGTLTGSQKKRGHRLPDDWQLPKHWGEWALSEGLDELTIRREAENFRDYWHSKPGKDALKLDWELTWRRWVRRRIEDRGLPAISGGSHGTTSRQSAGDRAVEGWSRMWHAARAVDSEP